MTLLFSDILDYVGDNRQEFGRLRPALLVGVVAIGFAATTQFLLDLIPPKAKPTAEIHNKYVFRPQISATGWDDPLAVNEETIAEAMRTAKLLSNSSVFLISKDCHELTACWSGKDWNVEIHKFASNVTQYAVERDSKWSGLDEPRGLWSVFRRTPKGKLTDAQVLALFRSFLGLGNHPVDLTWATIRYGR